MTPFWFTPRHQPAEGREVRFQLRPLDKRARYAIQVSLNDQGRPTQDVAHETVLGHVTGWDGVGPVDSPVAFSRAALRRYVDEGEASAEDFDWMIWVFEIVGTLYARSMMSPDQKKA